jgi:AAA+ ATPase superfamily predicted ATPase
MTIWLKKGLMMFVSREEDLERMDEIVEKQDSSFVAIYGRRRVGKTLFVRHFCNLNSHFFIEFTGKRDIVLQPVHSDTQPIFIRTVRK